MPNPFEFIKSNAASVEKIQQVREKASEFAAFLATIAPNCRELSLAMTNLEQAAMWANRAIVVNQVGE